MNFWFKIYNYVIIQTEKQLYKLSSFSSTMKLTDFSPENRPRERLQKEGPQSLSTAELLAIILKSGTQKENVLEMAQRLLGKYGLEKMSSCSLQELQEQHGIGTAKACQIVSLFELYRRIPLKNESIKIRKAEDIANIYLPKLSHLKKEQFVAVYLDTKFNVISEQIITIGTLNSSLVHSREVFHGAIKNLAHAVIVLHNHPSGDPQPSEEDLQVTEALLEAGDVIGIKLLDHVIIGKDTWWSWKEHQNV
ncbi:hypothetical protein COV20_02420 [Candidatus Woesearchaeota archaeon CG10_big_fil_rev_8_21_14_0_10_45_16]|nr:MAG: hypothetical protein COV20_02420 [Candidatus Woesearchaeota archaeon CG10_big_fil_rev_8_21_14_0_10_45_16]